MNQIKTKTIATLGPSSNSLPIISDLIEYGMDLTQEQIEKKHNSLDKMLWFRNFYASLCLETDDSFFKNSFLKVSKFSILISVNIILQFISWSAIACSFPNNPFDPVIIATLLVKSNKSDVFIINL